MPRSNYYSIKSQYHFYCYVILEYFYTKKCSIDAALDFFYIPPEMEQQIKTNIKQFIHTMEIFNLTNSS